jgi:catechol 2,3-dioxygenase
MTHLVHAIGHVKINTTAVEAVVQEAEEILGLRVTHSDNRQTWLSSNGRAAELVLLRSDENSVHTVGLEALSSDAVRAATDRVESAGCRVLSREPSLSCMAAGVTFATPEGLRFEIHTPIRDDLYGRRYATHGVRPNRMDHLNLTTPDPVATQRQLEKIGGLRLSERMADNSLCWMYGGNRQHHIVGLVRGETGLHHYSFEIREFSDYLKLGDLLDQFQKELVWGPGRHRPGDNTYAYYKDSSGAMIECSGSMALIADDDGFDPIVITELARPNNVRRMNVWGTPAPLEWRQHSFPFAVIAR